MKKIRIQMTGELSWKDEDKQRQMESLLDSFDGKTVKVTDLTKELRHDFFSMVKEGLDRSTLSLKITKD